VVGFVDDDHVPSGVDGLLAALVGIGEEGYGAEDPLLVEEGVASGVAFLEFVAAGFVVDAEPEVEAAQEFHKPLVYQ